MSALTDLFTAMANKIRSKTGTQTTYTPSEMVSDGIDDVFDAGVASVPTPTSITPSNSSPVSLTANTPVNPTASGYAISSYTNRTPSTTNRSYTSLSSGTINRIQTRTGYLYGAKPTGRNLLSYTAGLNTDSTSWHTLALSSATTTAYDADGTGTGFLLDENFAHCEDGGNIVVDRAISTAYIAGIAWYGRTSSGTTVYSGVRMLKNGTVITGASAYGSSSDTSPSFRRIATSFAVGDIIQIQTRVSSTTGATTKYSINITTP